MDQLTELQHVVDRAAEAATDLASSQMQIDNWAAILRDAGPDGRDSTTAGALAILMIEAAECHDDTCDEDPCCMCDHLRNGVAMVLAAARADVDEELERRLRYDPEQAKRRTKLIPRKDAGQEGRTVWTRCWVFSKPSTSP